MPLKNSLLALLFCLCVAVLCDWRANADPNCDSLCRLRQFHYNRKTTKYRKYETTTCELCQDGAKTYICLIQTGDANTNATCTTQAGGENANKYWEIQGKTVCSFTSETWIESEKGDPLDEKNFTKADLKVCPVTPIE